mgnify:FL=1
MPARSTLALVVIAATAAMSCGNGDSASTSPSAATATGVTTSGDEQLFPDIVDVAVTADGDTFRFDVTVSSPYDTPERYADAWRILAPDGTELAVRELTHDHAGEQPFTRSLNGVVIPPDVTTVTVEGRDLVNGWGGGTQTVSIER